MRLGKQLVALGYVSEVQLTQVLVATSSACRGCRSSASSSPRPARARAGEVADRHCVMPIYVRSVRDQGDTLYVAMDDPTDEEVLRKIADAASMPVRPMIASPTEIRRAIEQRYFGAPPGPFDDTGMGNLPHRGAKQYAPANDNKSAEAIAKDPPKTSAPAKIKKPPPPPGPGATRPDALVALEQYDAPSQPPPAAGGAQRTLTLLDGTQVKSPSARKAAPAQDVRAVRHIIKAIRAAKAELAERRPPALARHRASRRRSPRGPRRAPDAQRDRRRVAPAKTKTRAQGAMKLAPKAAGAPVPGHSCSSSTCSGNKPVNWPSAHTRTKPNSRADSNASAECNR